MRLLGSPDSDLATDLRDYGGALELDYAVRIDVVSAGLSTERASGELAAAAREAMLNAARHAGGEISVYIEGAASAVDVYIRDRGAGFRLDDVPGDRLGVRQSIIGRMRRGCDRWRVGDPRVCADAVALSGAERVGCCGGRCACDPRRCAWIHHQGLVGHRGVAGRARCGRG